MKMGTIVSRWRYDAAAAHAIQPVNLRRHALLHYASWAALVAIPRVARPLVTLTIDREIDVIGHKRRSGHAPTTRSFHHAAKRTARYSDTSLSKNRKSFSFMTS
jgi:hypothetical protein